MVKKVLVTGASGFVGSFVVKEFLNHGFQVRGLARQTSDLSALNEKLADVGELKSNFTLVIGDITNPESLQHAAEGVAGIVHIAALFREAKHSDQVYHQVNVDGVKNVLEVAEALKIPMVHCSTVGVHSHIPNPPATEEEEYRPADIYQETKCLGEKLALEWFIGGRVKGIVIRPAMIWGPSDNRTLKMFKGIAKGRFPMIGWGKTYLHWISVIDLATSFRLALEALNSGDSIKSGEVFIISGKSPVLLKDLLKMIAEELNVKPPQFAIPALPIQMLGSICEALCRPLGIEPPLHRRRVDFFTKTRWFDSTKAHKLLGFNPRGDLRSEIKEIIKDYTNRGYL